MKALICQGPRNKVLGERLVPEIKAPTDAILKISRMTICAPDLHILKGDLQTSAGGRILGHEGIGVVGKIGPGVTNRVSGYYASRVRPRRSELSS
jgi:alcohol dehydrogenase